MKKTILSLVLSSILTTGSIYAADSHMLTRWGESLDRDNVWNVYPRPALARDNWTNLNGEWEYAIVPVNTDKPEMWDGKILVPFAVESTLSGVGKRVGEENELWYRRQFEIPAEWQGQDIILNFGGVDWRCNVWVNGIKVGSHEGAYAPFSFNITEAIKYDAPNEIVVSVFDPTDTGYQPRGKQVSDPHGIWYTPVTGIWQTVWMEPVASTHIENVRIIPDLDSKTFTIKPAVTGNNDDIQVAVRVKDGKETVVSTTTPLTNDVVVKMPNDVKLWSPDSPSIYEVEIDLLKGGKIIDNIKSYTAMRKFSTGRDATGTVRLKLNDKNIFHFGPLDQGWWPDGLYTAPSYEALISDVDLAKQLGFNMIRKHIKTEPAVWYEYCDRAGIIVWQDMPSSERPGPWLKDFYEGEEMERSAESDACHRREWKEIIDYLYSEPCVAVWVPFNEGWGQYATVDISNWTKEYDPTRLVNPASGGNFFLVGDIVDVHHYPDPKMTLLRPTKANVLGEYGGIGLVVPGHMWDEDNNWGYIQYDSPEEVTDVYVKYIEMLNNLARVAYTGAVYTQTSDVENEANGFITYDRSVIKVDVDRVSQANSKLIHDNSED